MKKELNISEILKGKPKGIRLYSPIFGDTTLDGYNKSEAEEQKTKEGVQKPVL